MPLNGHLTLEESKRVAVQGEDAPLGLVAMALDTLYLEVRRYEDLHAVQQPAGSCSCHPSRP